MIHIDNILLIDDDYITNIINENVLKNMHVSNNITIATSGKEGLSFIKKNYVKHQFHCPQLILLDINMPVMNGFQFLQAFKEMEGKADNIYVFMLSSSFHPRDLARAESFYVSGYISKPLTEIKLKEAIYPIFFLTD